MTVLCEEISRSSRCNKEDSNHKRNKGAIYNAIKAAVMKSILIQIAKVRVANGFHRQRYRAATSVSTTITMKSLQNKHIDMTIYRNG
jgi:hypothetical protein